MTRKALTLSLTYVSGSKSCHRGSIEDEESEYCEMECRKSISHIASDLFGDKSFRFLPVRWLGSYVLRWRSIEESVNK